MKRGWNRVAEVMVEGVATLDLGIKEVVNALWKKVLKTRSATALYKL